MVIDDKILEAEGYATYLINCRKLAEFHLQRWTHATIEVNRGV